MKAILTTISHDRDRLIPYEQYRFETPQIGPEGRRVSVYIEGHVLRSPLIKWNEKDWEYDIEVTITAKPKREQLIIKL